MRVVLSTHSTTPKHHLIFSESASLVGEDVLDLAQVFIDVQSPAHQGPVIGSMVHAEVPANEVDLDQFDYLHCHIQGHGDDHLYTCIYIVPTYIRTCMY